MLDVSPGRLPARGRSRQVALPGPRTRIGAILGPRVPNNVPHTENNAAEILPLGTVSLRSVRTHIARFLSRISGLRNPVKQRESPSIDDRPANGGPTIREVTTILPSQSPTRPTSATLSDWSDEQEPPNESSAQSITPAPRYYEDRGGEVHCFFGILLNVEVCCRV
jgi:hypothetical protein